MRIVLTTLAGGLVLSACATPPQVAHQGDLTALKGRTALAVTGPAAPADAALAQAIQARVQARVLAEAGAISPGLLAPRYRLEVGVGVSPVQVGVAAGTQAGDAPWRSAPTKLRPWSRRGPVRTATLAVLDLSTGEVTAWASVRAAGDDAEDLADRLIAALSPAKV